MGAVVVRIVGGVGRAFSGSIVAFEEGVNGAERFGEFNTSEALTCRLACGVISSLSGAKVWAGADIRVSLTTGLSGTVEAGAAIGTCFGGSLTAAGSFAMVEIGGYEGGPRGAILV